MRAQIRADIKAHGQTFSGPEVVPPSLLKAIEGKRLVGLGEGTHGTSEVQTLLGNIILAMAKKGRVVVFMEDQFGSVAPINRFVQGTGEGDDLPKAMNGLYGVHKTREFEDFFRAVRTFNETAPAGAKIEIYGVDNVIWPGPADPTPLLKAFCAANDLKLDAELAVCAAYFQDPKSQTPATRAACVGAAAKIQLVVDGVAPAVSGQVEATVLANVLVKNLQQDEAANGRFAGSLVNKLGDGPANTIINGSRDAGMAENIKILMDGKIPRSGVGVFWAHNAHIGRISYLDGDPIGHPSTWGNAGCILSTWLGVSANQVVHPSCSGKLKVRPNSFQRSSDEPPQFSKVLPCESSVIGKACVGARLDGQVRC
jgi:erythromycin esterase-like protein